MARLIDTVVFIEWERAGLPADDLSATIGGSIALASVSASELLAGVHRAQPSARRDRRQAFVDILLTALPVLPFDLEAARVHAQLNAAMMSAGQLVGAYDLLIAATAMSRGYAVVTRHRRDFDRVPGLTVEEPDWP